MDSYVGEIRIFAGNYAPQDWLFCDGTVLQISQYNTLFSLIGTTYGGDGKTTFALPDLRGRVPVHTGTLLHGGTYAVGQKGGVENVAVTPAQLPGHSHVPQCSSGNGTSADPTNMVWAAQPTLLPYLSAGTENAVMKTGAVTPDGGGQVHDNMVPFLGLNFIICMNGIFPTQN